MSALSHYDQANVAYDAGLFFADEEPVAMPIHYKHMASLKLNITRMNPFGLIALADNVIGKLAPAAPATPPVPNMAAKVTSLTTARTNAETANDAYETAKAGLAALKQARDSTADLLRLEHTSVAAAVESEAKGDPVMLSASGYALAGAPVQSTQPPGQLTNLTVTAGDDEGEIDVGFDPEALARTNEVQTSDLPPPNAVWVTKAQFTGSKTTLAGLTSGHRVWVRARAIGANGPGPWSDLGTKIIP